MAAQRTERVETVVVGGGQAGLAVGYHLAQRNRPFVILDANERVGDSWRKRWPSLQLYSPALVDGLPGMRFPAPSYAYPTGHEMADYLETYAERFALPVANGVRVKTLDREDGGYEPRHVEVLARNPEEIALKGLAADIRVALTDPFAASARDNNQAAPEAPQ